MNKRNFLANGKFLLKRRQTNILSAAIILMIMILASGILGLVRDRLLAGNFFSAGQQWQLDIYFASFRIPDIIFQILVLGTLSAAFIPVFSEYLVKDEKEAYYLASSILNIGLVIYLVLGSIVFFFARPLANLITHSLEPHQLDLMVNLMRLLLVSQAFFLVSNFLTGILQSNQRFLLPAFSSVLYNLGIILGIKFFSPLVGIYGPVLGVVVGAFLHGIVQLPLVKSLGFNYKLVFDFQHKGVKKIAKLMVPRTISFALDQVSLSVNVFIATALAAGSLSIYNFAQHLSNLPVGLFGLTIGQAALPALAREVSRDKKNFRILFISSFHQILFLALPASIILLVLRIPAVRLAFGAKAFPWEATLLTGKVVGFLSLSIFAQGIIELLIRTFYAFQDTKTPLVLKSIVVVVNVLLSFVFVFKLGFGIVGLAAATTLTFFLHAFLLFIFLESKVGLIFKKEVFMPVAKMALATFLAGLFLWWPMRLLDIYVLDTTKTIHLIVLTLITLFLGGGVYLFFSFMFKIKEINNFTTVLKRFGQWKQILSQTEEVLDEKQHS
ncbi:murein biosynthesis integral membrane protein MurJ [Patescibacteria group bacterium]